MDICTKIALTSMILSLIGAGVGGVAVTVTNDGYYPILGKIANVVALVAGIVSIVAMFIMIWSS